MLTKGMSHQLVGLERMAGCPMYYALACEQGTGKTWMLLADAERQFKDELIDTVLVIAPKGVHSNWPRREIPKHLEVAYIANWWVPEQTIKSKKVQALMLERSDSLRIFAMNIDSLNTERGYSYAAKFLKAGRCMMIVDESTRIKSPSAGRSKKTVKLGTLARSRRIASGTIMPNGPQDIFNQAKFLSPNLPLLGTSSFRAFVSEYTELLPENSPLYKAILEKTRGFERPQITAKDSKGRPKYKNLDKLAKLMSSWTYRVKKADCLDLPDKIYKIVGFDLPPAQRKTYDFMRDNLRIELEGNLHIFDKLVVKSKLRQAVSCFIMVDGEPTVLADKNPRMDLLKELIEDTDGKIIIWASFRAEIAAIADHLLRSNISFVQYHGGVNSKDRENAVDSFQEGEARIFVGNPQAGGIGLTLTAANTVIYYSNDYNLETRLQSEDRAHRIGTTNNVLYIDIVANDTIDEVVAAALQSKADVQESVMERLT